MRYLDDFIMFVGIAAICGSPLWVIVYIVWDMTDPKNPRNRR